MWGVGTWRTGIGRVSHLSSQICHSPLQAGKCKSWERHATSFCSCPYSVRTTCHQLTLLIRESGLSLKRPHLASVVGLAWGAAPALSPTPSIGPGTAFPCRAVPCRAVPHRARTEVCGWKLDFSDRSVWACRGDPFEIMSGRAIEICVGKMGLGWQPGGVVRRLERGLAKFGGGVASSGEDEAETEAETWLRCGGTGTRL
jgi:hypothetical protein